MKIFILAQTQELQLPSLLHQEHFCCHQRHFRHLPQLQRARKRQLQQELKSPGFPKLLLLTFRRTHTRSAGLDTLTVCRTTSAHQAVIPAPQEMEQGAAKGILFSLHMQQLRMLFPNPGTATTVLEMLRCESTRETLSCWAPLRSRHLSWCVLCVCH